MPHLLSTDIPYQKWHLPCMKTWFWIAGLSKKAANTDHWNNPVTEILTAVPSPRSHNLQCPSVWPHFALIYSWMLGHTDSFFTGSANSVVYNSWSGNSSRDPGGESVAHSCWTWICAKALARWHIVISSGLIIGIIFSTCTPQHLCSKDFYLFNSETKLWKEGERERENILHLLVHFPKWTK